MFFGLGNGELRPAFRENRTESRTHSDFADGPVDPLAAGHLLQGDGVELAFVEVRHGAVSRLLAKRL